MLLKIRNIFTCSAVMIVLLQTIVFADVFYTPGEYNALYNEKIALELQIKSLKRQYGNERRDLLDKIKGLENKIETLGKQYKSLQEKCDSEKKLCEKRIAELEKRTDILKEKGSEKEKSLIAENRALQTRCSADLDKLKKQLDEEKEKHIQELAALKDKYEKEISKLQTSITNLNAELDDLKKLNKEQRQKLSRMANQAKDLEKQLNEEIKKGEIRLKKFHDRLIINIDEKISFDSGKARLKRNIMPSLKKIREILHQYPEYKIIVEGHTDNVPIKTRKFRNNWHLSSARALAVLDYLLKKKDLNPGRFTVAGHGEYSPVVPNNTKENRAMNRRVDIVVIPMIKTEK